MSTKTKQKPLTIAEILDYPQEHCLYQHADKFYTTDGRIAFCTDAPIEGIEYGKKVKRSPDIDKIIAKPWQPFSGEPVTAEHVGASCLRCKGSGFVNTTTCSHCKGEGDTECETCGHEEECYYCSGHGFVGGERCVCDKGQHDTAVAIGDVHINRDYFEAVMGLPGAKVFGVHDDDNHALVRFDFDGGVCVVSGLYRS